jgi:hypothetical protein
MQVLIADLDENRTAIGQQFLCGIETVTQIWTLAY